MIKKIERVSKKLFQEVFSGGKSKNTLIFSAKMAISEDGMTRFAVVVPKTVAKKAHDRNRIRRIFYTAIKNSYKAGSQKAVFLFICKKEVLGVDKNQINLIIQGFFKDLA